MKKITLLFTMLLMISFSFSQDNTLPFDFQDNTNPMLTFDCDSGNCPTGTVIDNPDMSGINTSSKVYEYVRNVGVAWYSGFVFDQSLRPTPLVNVSSDGKVFKLKIWSTKAPIDVRFQLEQGSPDPGASPSYEVIQTVNTANTWVELTFDFSSTPLADTMAYNAISIFPDWDPGNQTLEDEMDTYYFDDIEATNAVAPTCDDGIQNGDEEGIDCGGSNCAPCTVTCDDGIQNGDEEGVDCGGTNCDPCAPSAPTTAAPTPTPLQSQVINMYSNAYTTDVSVSSWRSAWSSGDYTDNVLVDGAGSECKQYLNADFVGVEFYGTPVDATGNGMQYFHVDVWSPVQTLFSVKLVDLGSGTTQGFIQSTIPTGQWVSLDLPLADFATAGLTLQTSIQQLLFDGTDGAPDNFNFFIDNVYFSSVPSLSTTDYEIVNFSVFPNPSQDAWNVKTTNQNISSIQLFDMQGRQVLNMVPNASEVTIDGSSLPSGLYFAKINSGTTVNSIKLIKN